MLAEPWFLRREVLGEPSRWAVTRRPGTASAWPIPTYTASTPPSPRGPCQKTSSTSSRKVSPHSPESWPCSDAANPHGWPEPGQANREGPTPLRLPHPKTQAMERRRGRRAVLPGRSRCAALSCGAFLTIPAGHRSFLRGFVPGFRGISSLAALPPVFHDPALHRSRSLSISLAGRQKNKLSQEREQEHEHTHHHPHAR